MRLPRRGIINMLNLSEWVTKYLPLFYTRAIDRAEAEVVEGKIKIYFHEWEIRIELTPNEKISERIINRGA